MNYLLFWLLLNLLNFKVSPSTASTGTSQEAGESAPFGCLNGQGQFVHWWFIYKQSDGLSYVYLDSSLSVPLPVNEFG